MANPEAIVSKGRFAEICNVDPSRVSQWIKEGKISGSALVGEGRTAKIIVAVAQKQLRSKIDSGQAFGNGLGTKLGPSEPRRPQANAEPSDDAADESDSPIDQQIKRERLEALQRTNRRAAEDEAAGLGRYTETIAVRRQLGVVASQTMRVFDGAQPEIATAIASRFSLEEREVLQLLNELFRAIREQAADKAKAAAADLPALVPDDAEDPAEA